MLYLVPLILVLIYNLPIISKKKAVVLTMAPILLLTMFRYGFGADYFSYKTIYVGMEMMDFRDLFTYYDNIDIGFRLLMVASSWVGLPYHTFNVIITFSIIGVFAAWIYDLTDSYKEFTLGITLFYSFFIFVWGWSALRQGIVLSFGTYLFLNPRYNFSNFKKICFVLVLSLFHLSALIYIPLLFIPKLSKKKLAIFVIAGIIFSVLPFGIIIQQMSNFPVIGAFVNYIDTSSINILTFSGITRLVLVSIAFYFYDDLEKNMQDSRILQIFIIGFGFYFFTSISPIAAGRLHAFTYVLIIPIIITLWSTRKYKQTGQIIIKLAIISFAMLYTFKEINTMASQSLLADYGVIIPYVNVFNKDDHKFETMYEFLSTQILDSIANFREFEEKNDYRIAKPKKGDQFVSVRSNRNGYYGVINQNGEVVVDFAYHLPVNIYGHIYEKVAVINSIYRTEYIDIFTKEPVNPEVIVDDFVKVKLMQNTYVKADLAGLGDVNESVSDLFNFPNRVGRIYINYLNQPFDYNIFSFKYFDRDQIVFLDKNNKPIVNRLFQPSDAIDAQGFIHGETPKTKEVYNQDGELIWIEKG